MTSATAEVDTSDASYIDYEIFLSPSFSAPAFANSLVVTTNNPTDTPLDLATPLSRVLFDIQEVDSHIHNLTTSSALPLLTHTQSQTASSLRIVDELSGQVASLNDSYQRLEKEILGRYEAAEEVRKVSERLWHTVRLGRAVGRALQLGRQLEVQMAELQGSSTANKPSTAAKSREDHRAMIRASNTILNLRVLFAASSPGEEGEGLVRVNIITTLRNDLINSIERNIRSKAQQIIREFSMSSSGSTTYAQTEDTKSRTTSAFQTLYLLSYQPSSIGSKGSTFVPELLVTSLEDYLRTSATSSLASLTRSLGALPSLDRILIEISSRCQNIAALEVLLESIKPPPLPHPLSNPNQSKSSHGTAPPKNLLQPLLDDLETSSLPSHFWRSLGSALVPKVQEIVQRGGVQVRTLRTNRNSIRDAIRECVLRGCVIPPGITGTALGNKGVGDEEEMTSRWDREVAVMTGAVINQLPK